jgi:hypothetical protein
MDRLKGKVALISGAARGQGAAEARLFASEGAMVVLGDVRDELLKQTADAIPGRRGSVPAGHYLVGQQDRRGRREAFHTLGLRFFSDPGLICSRKPERVAAWPSRPCPAARGPDDGKRLLEDPVIRPATGSVSIWRGVIIAP